jgi:hypothetical protein
MSNAATLGNSGWLVYDGRVPDMLAGSITKFLLYDVADAIDLPRVRQLFGTDSETSPALRPRMSPYVDYRHRPVAIDGASAGIRDINGFHVRIKAFGYGVISVALRQPVPNDWDRLLADARYVYDDPELVEAGDRARRALMDRIAPALIRPRSEPLSEDYLVVTATRTDDGATANQLLAVRGGDIAQLLRGESETLSDQEREEILRHRISYFATDLVVPTWNGAFVLDTEAGAEDVMEILEFANSQLLEFRYYDRLLDKELERIYAQLQRPASFRTRFGRRFTRAARQVHSLFIDVNELTDKTENAMKIAGDVYGARLFTLVAGRLGLDHWKGNVREKLKTLDDIYRFAVEQTSMARGEFLELAIVLILVFELILFFAGVMR